MAVGYLYEDGEEEGVVLGGRWRWKIVMDGMAFCFAFSVGYI